MALFCTCCPEVPKIGATTEDGGRMEVAELTRLAPAGAAPVEVDAAGSIMLSPIIWKAWSELDRFILGAGLPRYFAESVASLTALACVVVA